MKDASAKSSKAHSPPVEDQSEARLQELNTHIDNLSFERTEFVRTRNSLLLSMYRDGYTVDKLAELSDLHPDDVSRIVHSES